MITNVEGDHKPYYKVQNHVGPLQEGQRFHVVCRFSHLVDELSVSNTVSIACSVDADTYSITHSKAGS